MSNTFNYLPSEGMSALYFRAQSQNGPQVQHPMGTNFNSFLQEAYGFLIFTILPQIKGIEGEEINFQFNGCVGASAFEFEFVVNGYIIRISNLGSLRCTLVINPAKNDLVFDINQIK